MVMGLLLVFEFYSNDDDDVCPSGSKTTMTSICWMAVVGPQVTDEANPGFEGMPIC